MIAMMVVMAEQILNPFRYGALALDEAFTDREQELSELESDIRNGQDVVLFAPRRYGKSSLVWRVAQTLVKKRVLVAQVDLMTTPTRERLAEKLAATIYEDVASPLFRAKERLRVFGHLRIKPTVVVDPEDGSLSFTFEAGRTPEDLDDTLERLLELPGKLAAERERQAVLILDEFQEIVDIDRELPKLMRAVFQQQPEVAHVYLGSKRHMMERIFSDENEPFWRSAKQMELGVIEPARFEGYLAERFAGHGTPDSSRGDLPAAGHHPRPPLRHPGARLFRMAGIGPPPRGRPGARWTPRSTPSCAPSTPTSRWSGAAHRRRSAACSTRWRGRPATR